MPPLAKKKRGNLQMNIEKGPLKTRFLKFILPSMAAQWIFALYTMIDGMFVARGVSEDALSAVNIASPYINFLFSVSILFAVGTSTIVSIYMGKGEHEQVNRVYTQSLVTLGVIAVIIMAAVFFNLEWVINFLGATDVNRHYVREYILAVLPFSWCFIIAYSFEILVKADGYPGYAVFAIVSGAVMHCGLDYIFVFLCDFGVRGAGLATGISQCALIFIYLKHFLGPKASMRLERFRFSFMEFVRMIKIGASSFLTEFSAGITVFLFNHAILRYIGNDGVISYTIVAYVNTIVIMSMAGIAQGAQPLISFYFGKGEMGTCWRLYRYGLISCTVLAAVTFISSMLGADLLVNIFISADLPELRAYSTEVFRIFSISFLLMGFNIVSGGFFTALEMPKSAFAVTVARGLVTLALALFLCTAVMGGAGIWWAPTVSEIMCLALSAGLMFGFRARERRKSALAQ